MKNECVKTAFNIAEIDQMVYDGIVVSLLNNSEAIIDECSIKRLPTNECKSLDDLVAQYYKLQIMYAEKLAQEEEKLNTIDIIVKKIAIVNRCIDVVNNRNYKPCEVAIRIIENINVYPMDSAWFYEITEMVEAETSIMQGVKLLLNDIDKSSEERIGLVNGFLKKIYSILQKERNHYNNKFES